MNSDLHPCEIIYALSDKPVYGEEAGICRITGKESKGIEFTSWVRDTFTDLGYLVPGTIISNEAAYCFDEASEYLRQKAGKEKPQRFRNYSHFVVDGQWHMRDKGQKADMLLFMLSNPEICVISESGQKHLLFKNTPKFWQLEEALIYPDIERFKIIHTAVTSLSEYFSNEEMQTGLYNQYRIIKFGHKKWFEAEQVIRQFRGSAIFDLAIFFSKTKYDYNGN